MPERWAHELQKWGRVRAPQRIRTRIEEGPRGEGMPPLPGRGQRALAGVLALTVFGAAGWLVLRAFASPPDVPPISVVPPVVPPGTLGVRIDPPTSGPWPSAVFVIDGRTLVAGPHDMAGWGQEQALSDTHFELPSMLLPGTPLVVTGDAGQVLGTVSRIDPGPSEGRDSPRQLTVNDRERTSDLLRGMSSLPNHRGPFELVLTATWPEGKAVFVLRFVVGPMQEEPPLPSVRVPDVGGLTEDEALDVVARAGLQGVVRYTYIDAVQPGTAGSVSPTPGTRVSRGTAVEIAIAVPGQPPENGGGYVFIERFQRAHPGVLFGGRRGPDGFPVAVFEPGQDPADWMDELDELISYPSFGTAVCPVSSAELRGVDRELLRRGNAGLIDSKGFAFGVDELTCSVRLEGEFPTRTIASLQNEFGDLITIYDGLRMTLFRELPV